MFPVVLSNIKKIIFIGGDALELCLGAQALRRVSPNTQGVELWYIGMIQIFCQQVR